MRNMPLLACAIPLATLLAGCPGEAPCTTTDDCGPNEICSVGNSGERICAPSEPDEPSISSFTATPGIIDVGQSSMLAWSTTKADSCNIDNGVGAVAANGTRQVAPSTTTAYTLVCVNSAGIRESTVTVTVNPPVQILSFTANGQSPSTSVDAGSSVTLAWSTANATTCRIDNGLGSVETTGSITAAPTQDTIYTLTCEGSGGPVSADVEVSVNPAVAILSFTANDDVDETAILQGDSAVLRWSTENATTCSLDDGSSVSPVSTNGEREVSPVGDVTYLLSCDGVAGPATAQVTVRVRPPVAILSFQATPDVIDYGDTATLAWSTDNATDCEIDNGIGAVMVNGNTSVNPSQTTIYSLTCDGAAGPVSDEVTVTVNPPVRILSFGASAQVADFLSNVDLTWSTENATSCLLDNNIGSVSRNGTLSARIEALPGSVATYTLTCEGIAGPVNASVEIDVNNHVYVGNIVVCGPNAVGTCTPSSDLATLENSNTVQGDVTIEGTSLPNLAFPKLVRVTGSVVLANNTATATISLPNLRHTGGSFGVIYNWEDGAVGDTSSIDLTSLETVGAGFTVRGAHPSAVTAPALTSINGAFLYTHNSNKCADLNFAALGSVGDRMWFFNTKVVSYTAAFPSLTSVGGNLDVGVESGALDSDVEAAFADVSVGGTTSLEGATTDGCH